MGVALEAIAETFGYRLKKIDKPAPYSFSHHLSTLFAFAVDFSPLYIASP
jgi:lysozyme family protein